MRWSRCWGISFWVKGDGLRWMGVALICVGVVFVGRTPPSTTEKG